MNGRHDLSDQEFLKDLAAYVAGLSHHVDIIIPFQLDEKGQRIWKAGYQKAAQDVLDRVMARLNRS